MSSENEASLQMAQELKWQSVLQRMPPIGLEALASVAVENRVDTKFLMTTDDLLAALESLADQYKVLEVEGGRMSPYRTVYFDTPQLSLYSLHHRGARRRYKIRKRAYLNTGHVFFELKSRLKAERTIKNRQPIDEMRSSLSSAERAAIEELIPVDARLLTPALDVRFSRISLLSQDGRERLTCDINIVFGRNGETSALPGLAIAELKQETLNRQAPFYRQMRRMNIRPTPFSKYCFGLTRLCEGLRKNQFKPVTARLQKILRDQHVEH